MMMVMMVMKKKKMMMVMMMMIMLMMVMMLMMIIIMVMIMMMMIMMMVVMMMVMMMMVMMVMVMLMMMIIMVMMMMMMMMMMMTGPCGSARDAGRPPARGQTVRQRELRPQGGVPEGVLPGPVRRGGPHPLLPQQCVCRQRSTPLRLPHLPGHAQSRSRRVRHLAADAEAVCTPEMVGPADLSSVGVFDHLLHGRFPGASPLHGPSVACERQ